MHATLLSVTATFMSLLTPQQSMLWLRQAWQGNVCFQESKALGDKKNKNLNPRKIKRMLYRACEN